MGCCGEARDGTVQSPNQPMMGQAQPSYNVTQPLGTQPMQAPTQQWGQSPLTPPPPTQPSPFGQQNTGGAMNLQPMQSFGPSPQPGFSNQSPAPPSTVETGNQGPQGMNMNTGYSPLLNGNPNIIRPSPVHAGTPPVRTSPPLATSPPSGFASPPPMPMSMGAPIGSPPPRDDGKLSISVDFGTTASGVAYGSSRINNGKVQNIIHWPGSFENFRKVPTCLLYNEHGQVLAWGLEAKNASQMPGTIKCEWFKLFLSPRSLRDPSNIDPRLPKLPAGKTASEAIVDYLSCLYEYARQQITREIGAVADLNSADVWLTVPAAWDAAGCDIMREAAIKAGLVQSAHAGDRNWRDRLRIITEPEAAAVHCVHLTDLHKLKPSQNFMVCDAGGGTVDLAVYRVIGSLTNLEIAEVCARSGANCGSIFLDMRFRELVRTLLSDHPVHLDPASQAFFMHAFAETEKLAYMGESDDDNYFHFTCFNVEDANDPNVGLVNGELAIPGNLLRREVFDPVIEQVLELLEDQVKKVSEPISALMLVGGFSGSEYLFKRVYDQFSSRIKVIARPDDADTATSRGAAQYGLARRPLVSSVISGKAYLMKVKLPAESDDWLKRPAYIKQNNAGATVCENRVQYLVHKGAILLKGQRIKTKFCKFSTNPSDRIFVAVLYTSESDKVMRYTDEGETQELCKWSVDLGMLPSFQYQASLPQPNGFYTEFELGLELDSAEVRGVLLHNGQEVSRVVFDFFQ